MASPKKPAKAAADAKAAAKSVTKPRASGAAQSEGKGTIRVGIGGWTFEPWRGTFFPDDLPQAKELHFASRQLSVIEVNGTYYRTQTPKTFAKWAADTPDGFVFTLKGPRFATNRRVLAEAGSSVEHFLKSGVAELGDKLGPLVWQFAPTKKFDAEDFGAFLALLPEAQDGIKLQHAVEVRHASFIAPEFVALAAKRGVAIVYADHVSYPAIADVTADFVYARLQRGSDDIATAYDSKDLNAWAKSAKSWAGGDVPAGLPRAAPDLKPAKAPRDVFMFIIHEGKVRAPQGAMALAERTR